MKTSETIIEIARALLEAQKKIGAAKKGATNPFFHSTYASLGDVMEACKDILNENGITILQPVMNNAVETVLLHESGEWISSETPITPKLTKTTKENGDVVETLSDPQATGSAISYARRYGLQSMVFIPAEDDDAERAVNRPSPKKEPTRESTEARRCSQHDEVMEKKYSESKKKDYWCHRNEAGEVCFGFGYLE